MWVRESLCTFHPAIIKQSSETCEPPSILNHNDEQRYMIPAQDFKIRDGHESTSSDLIPMTSAEVLPDKWHCRQAMAVKWR